MSPLQRFAASVLPALPVLSAALLLGGCGGYTSDYMPLADGRARAVYRDDNLVLEIGGGISRECADAIADARSPGSGAYVEAHSTGHVWVPVYYGPRIVVVSGGLAPPPRHTMYTGASPHFSGVSSGPGRTGGGGRGGSSGGNSNVGGLGKEAVVIMAVLAMVALPAITFGLALGRPEPEEEVANVMDRVNLYNDLARTPGSPCAVEYAPVQGDRPQ